ncbi:class I SAM-dependent methyltransferase [Streptomyces pluripotens]|uniref:Class I SAM-dependent methyltransferase n=1 Tax=Streptomyces pluripotens TaxID=1355015 RepID=A0A221P375_9ACTN|nr:class I SAM-dependent methyltransferase [Streptomyces pluripotens]ARP72343.1 methyltransferase type 11 [Streptomyces pluripotens]ASN26594.1 class I SAM-dependent methyltransferase [Streptomyces pluripotens]
MERRDVRGHYDELAAEYDEYWIYGPHYVPWMSSRIAEALRLAPRDRIADVGSGTGLFASEVANQLRPRHPILCVDPSEAMLSQLGTPPPADLTPIVASAEDIAEGRTRLPYEQLDAMWLKESVHHVADPAHTLRGLADRLAPGGRLLVVMLPATIQYPLFKAALARFEELQPDPAVIEGHLRAAGLEASLSYVEHELRIDRDKYLGMVRARYMSLLSTFSDSEIEKGIEEMRIAHPEPELVFPDRFAFILGRRRGESV